MDEQQRIDAYIKQMMEIKAKKDDEQIKADLKAISQELGMSDEDLQAIEEERKKLILLGKGFIDHQQADDALLALEKAYALNPDDAETLSLLAQAHGMKFVQTGQQQYKKKSEEYAAQALLQNPSDQKALALLQSVRYKPKQEVQWGKVSFLVGMVGAVGLAGFLIFGTSKKPDRVNKESETVVQSDNKSVQANEQTIEYTNNIGDKAVFKFSDNEVKIEFDGKVIKGKTKSAEKNKYKDANGNEIMEVKAKDADGFKVRTPDGSKLLWKVKLDGVKVKVSDNEENQNPFELKKKDGKIKVSRNGQEIIDLKGKEKHSEAAMYLSQIPKEQRYIIIAELLQRNM
ncbi:MAG: hypothetical protein MUC49_12920 [Raineya sp.]|jgi:hypothetical protein|nr:hypothetical protein [Raineya sp.]